jgi:hypothetical protein
MERRSYDDFEYDDDNDDSHRLRKFRKNEPVLDEKKQRWDRESLYDRDHDYDERR